MFIESCQKQHHLATVVMVKKNFLKYPWAHWHEEKPKVNSSPSSKIVMLTGVFRKRSLRGNRSGFLRMKRVVWLNCIITFDPIHTQFYKVYFLFSFDNRNVWGIVVSLHYWGLSQRKVWGTNELFLTAHNWYRVIIGDCGLYFFLTSKKRKNPMIF